jgi:hypothetical protein
MSTVKSTLYTLDATVAGFVNDHVPLDEKKSENTEAMNHLW